MEPNQIEITTKTGEKTASKQSGVDIQALGRNCTPVGMRLPGRGTHKQREGEPLLKELRRVFPSVAICFAHTQYALILLILSYSHAMLHTLFSLYTSTTLTHH